MDTGESCSVTGKTKQEWIQESCSATGVWQDVDTGESCSAAEGSSRTAGTLVAATDLSGAAKLRVTLP